MCCESVKCSTISIEYWGPQCWWTPQSHISWHLLHQLCTPCQLSHLWPPLHHPPMSYLCSEPPQALLTLHYLLLFWISSTVIQNSLPVFPSSLTWVPKNLHWSFPAISDLPEPVRLPLLPQKRLSPLWQGHALSPTCRKVLMWLWPN